MNKALERVILEGCHDFIQAWAEGRLPSSTDGTAYTKSLELRMQIDSYLGYCPYNYPEKRLTAEALPDAAPEQPSQEKP